MKKDNKVKEYAWAVVISIAGSCVLTYLECTSCRADGSRFFDFASFSAINWMLLWTINSELNDFLSRKISWVKTPMKRFFVGVVSTVVFTALGVFAIMKFFEWLRDFEFASFADVVVPSLVITSFISLFFHGRTFLIQWRQSAVDAERYQKESITATYENLKSQVNPHFLFNSLNALTNLVYEDQDKAAKFIKQLSEVYRYVLDTRDREAVRIEEELKFLDSYAYLQQIRFGDKLVIKNSIQSFQSMIAPLALQMLLENAVKHNEVSEENPLQVELYEEGGYIIVKNNLQKRMQLGESSSELGLNNIVKRYKFLSDKSVEIQETTNHFIVKLPLIPISKFQ